MTAVDTVALARDAAQRMSDDGNLGKSGVDTRIVLSVFADGRRPELSLAKHDDAFMSASLTDENTASPDALTRALLASKITHERSEGAYVARLSEESWRIDVTPSNHGMTDDRYFALATRGLLDALLTSVPA